MAHRKAMYMQQRPTRFYITQEEDQTVVRSVAGVSTGDRVHVQVSDGMLQCDVAATSPDSPPRP